MANRTRGFYEEQGVDLGKKIAVKGKAISRLQNMFDKNQQKSETLGTFSGLSKATSLISGLPFLVMGFMYAGNSDALAEGITTTELPVGFKVATFALGALTVAGILAAEELDYRKSKLDVENEKLQGKINIKIEEQNNLIKEVGTLGLVTDVKSDRLDKYEPPKPSETLQLEPDPASIFEFKAYEPIFKVENNDAGMDLISKGPATTDPTQE